MNEENNNKTPQQDPDKTSTPVQSLVLYGTGADRGGRGCNQFTGDGLIINEAKRAMLLSYWKEWHL